jgi:hypothetical protein
MTRVLRIVALAVCVSAISSPPALGLSVSGNHLVDDSGRPKPTGFGIGFRNHLLKIRRHARG